MQHAYNGGGKMALVTPSEKRKKKTAPPSHGVC
jgi:hypothetical protein